MFKSVKLFFLTFLLSSFTFFSYLPPTQAAQANSNYNESDNVGIVAEETNDGLDASKTSQMPDLGDDQAFPFIPGFGKNSGKD